jgi:hypothetical protein
LQKGVSCFENVLSLPSLDSKGRVHFLRDQEEKKIRMRKTQHKIERKEYRKQQRLVRKQKKRERKLEQRLQQKAVLLWQNNAAVRIQQQFKRVMGKKKLDLRITQKKSARKLQACVRGYMVNLGLQKIVSAKARASAKKIRRWQAMITIIICVQMWIKRTRIKRWIFMLREVRAALQGGEYDWGGGPGEVQITDFNGIKVAREKREKGARARVNRRTSTVSAVAGEYR